MPLTVFVASGTSTTGSAAVHHILLRYPSVTVRAGTRSLSKADQKYAAFRTAHPVESKRLSFVEHNVITPAGATSDTDIAAGPLVAGYTPAEDANELSGVDVLVLTPPQVYDNRVGMAASYIRAAKKHVKHVILVSSPIARNPELIFGAGLHAIEQCAMNSGIPWTIVRCALFYENHWANKVTVSMNSAFYYCAKADVALQQVSVSDIGEAIANIVCAPAGPTQVMYAGKTVDMTGTGRARHAGKTYWLGGPALTWNQIATVYSQVLGRPIKFVTVPDHVSIKAIVDGKYPEILARGLCELHHYIESGAIPIDEQPLSQLLGKGRTPQTFTEWLTPLIPVFAPPTAAGTATATATATPDTAAATADSKYRSTIAAGIPSAPSTASDAKSQRVTPAPVVIPTTTQIQATILPAPTPRSDLKSPHNGASIGGGLGGAAVPLSPLSPTAAGSAALNAANSVFFPEPAYPRVKAKKEIVTDEKLWRSKIQSYLTDQSGIPAGDQLSGGWIHVKRIETLRPLQAMDVGDTSDPYFVFSIGDWSFGALKTQTVKGSLAPVYDLQHKPLSFPLTNTGLKNLRDGKLQLNVEVWDSDVVYDDFMGYTNLLLAYSGDRDRDFVFEVSVKDGTNPAGAIRLQINFQVEAEKKYVGTCLCKGTAIQVWGKPIFSGFCHCVQCAKFGGTDRALVIGYKPEKLIVSAGKDLLTAHKLTRVTRYFCSVCGTGMYNDAGSFMGTCPTLFGADDTYRVDSELLPTLHVHYGSSCLHGVVRDGAGLPLFRDFPKQIGGTGEIVREN